MNRKKHIHQASHWMLVMPLLALIVFVGSCANISEYTPESFRKNIDYQLNSVTITTRGFTFSSDISEDTMVPTKLQINTGELVRAALAGNPKQALQPMVLDIGIHITNNNGIGARVHSINAQVWFGDKLLTTLSNDEERDIKAQSSDNYKFNFPVPQSFDITSILSADSIRIKGGANISVLLENIPAARANVPFTQSFNLPFGILRNRLENSGVTL